jgi:ATP-dependent DNA ligase
MLLHKWEKHKGVIHYPCIGQIKIDGVRAIYDAELNKFFSRSGKQFDLPALEKECFGLSSFDCEIAMPTIVPLPEVINCRSEKHPDLTVYMFDLLPEVGASDGFVNRYVQHIKNIQRAADRRPHLQVVKMFVFQNEKQVHFTYKELVKAGYEGLVIRDKASSYTYGKRSKAVLKYKREYEDIFAITGIETAPHPEGDLVMFKCSAGVGKAEFTVTPAWTHKERRDFLAESYYPPAMMILVEYRDKSVDDIPIHAVGKSKYADVLAGTVTKKEVSG